MKIITTLCLVLLSVHSYSQEIIPEVETVTRDGLYEEFYENGQLWWRGNSIDGELDGLCESFHENGQLRWRTNYIDGKLEGPLEYFDRNGNLTKTETYRNGVVVE